ncbi:response regulator transcription factor [Flavivirga rizhaonensis]|uniref:DNA-binding response regulator n=1 Tax=Flavivirga rizhaonensis TaxID=2559571 RepID=A0A4S1DUN1_9FLAO|nr:response regulator transcription factor [Flavivirga rizhaonensis]TGV01801.1 DNA-binding response regulator [Flavivirga rizhaonensis]
METVKILIVEDDYDTVLYLKDLLINVGYIISGIFPKGEEAIDFVKKNTVDIILADIDLEGKIDGVKTVEEIKKIKDIFVIYITALKDKKTFRRANATFPDFFLSKPFNKFQLLDVIDKIISSDDNYLTSFSENYFFIKENGTYVYKKYSTESVNYIKADGSYTHIFFKDTPTPKITLSKNFKKTLSILKVKSILRIHRSYAININEIETIEEGKQIKLIGCGETFVVQNCYKESFNKLIKKL